MAKELGVAAENILDFELCLADCNDAVSIIYYMIFNPLQAECPSDLIKCSASSSTCMDVVIYPNVTELKFYFIFLRWSGERWRSSYLQLVWITLSVPIVPFRSVFFRSLTHSYTHSMILNLNI